NGVTAGLTDEPMRQYAREWVRKRDLAREQREQSSRWFVRCIFGAAVAAAVVAVLVFLLIWITSHMRLSRPVSAYHPTQLRPATLSTSSLKGGAGGAHPNSIEDRR